MSSIIRCNEKGGWMRTCSTTGSTPFGSVVLEPSWADVRCWFWTHSRGTPLMLARLIADNRCDLVVIPGEMASQLQPLDVCLNKPVKDTVRKYCSEWMEWGGHVLTPTGSWSEHRYPSLRGGYLTPGVQFWMIWMSSALSRNVAFQTTSTV